MEVIFEARQPDGKVFRIFENGTWEGFTDGTVVTNRWISFLHLERGLRVQALNKLCVANQKVAERLT